jgi:eukaryotic-like serine/threonine-protein kinase
MPPKQVPPRAGDAVPSSPAAASQSLIAGCYAVDASRRLPGAGGGLPAFAATDRRDGRSDLMAVQVAPGAPPRPEALRSLAELADPRLLVPLAYGAAPGADGRPSWFVVCTAPSGPALWPEGADAIRPWSETELIARLLRPAAAVLALLEARGLTHRALRPDNLFGHAAPALPVVLGCAWAAPPAALQPAVFEPPYMAMCAPAARGAGSIADDVYALGVTLLALALGRMPLAGLDDDSIIRRKLELGCFKALAGDARLPPAVADLVEGMLAHFPEHRPTPALLADPAAARARRVAARPPRRATRPLEVGGIAASDARSLGYAIARQPEQGARLVRMGVADHWLRRMLGDSTLAGRIEEVQRLRHTEAPAEDPLADARLVVRAVATLDPLAPVCWRGVALWPDAIGSALIAEPANPALRARIEEVVTQEVVFTWATLRAGTANPVALRQDARQQRGLLRQRGWAGGLPRLDYALNPLLPCRSLALADWPVARLEELLPALEAAASRGDRRATPPIDREMAAFIAARADGRLDQEVAAVGDAVEPALAAVAQLSMLAELQTRLKAPPLPGLAGWLAERAVATLEGWHSRDAQAARREAVAEAVPTGDLRSLLGIVDNPAARAADAEGHAAALDVVRRLDARIAALAGGGDIRRDTALRLGQEVSAVLGLAALVASIVAVAVG